jgi:AcrR family transcriptional regulator
MSIISDPGQRTRKKRGQGASRRGEILAAASRIFLEEGVASTTMRRIASAVGVSPTALYVYFPDKHAILQAIAEAWFAELLAVLEASQRGHDDVAAKFRAGLQAYVDFGRAAPDGYRLTFLSRQGSADPEPCSEIPEADHSFEILNYGVQEMMQAGLFRPGPSESVAEAIWASLHGVTCLLLDQSKHCRTPPDELVRLVLDMIMTGHR